jgi:hypothetical protein
MLYLWRNTQGRLEKRNMFFLGDMRGEPLLIIIILKKGGYKESM